MTAWSDTYVGTPFAEVGRTASGCDCWGLARLVYARELQISLPSCDEDYATTAETAEIAALLEGRHASPWREITVNINPFDLLLFRRGRTDTHVGVAIDRRVMLHMALGDCAKVESYIGGRWGGRFVGAYRHEFAATRVGKLRVLS